MTDTNSTYDKLQETITTAMLEMQAISGKTQEADFVSSVKILMIGLMTTAADLAELNTKGGAVHFYAEIEAAAKQGGLHTIQAVQKQGGREYSISGIDPNDVTTAMNYVGQKLSATLMKSIHELPAPMRNLEMFLRPIETLLGNLLDQKFHDVQPHNVLDSLCEHVHMILDDLERRKNDGNVTKIDFA